MPLIYPQLIQYDQQEPLTLDCFQNDEAIAEFLGLQEGIPQGDHKAGFAIDLDSTTYFGESTPSSSHEKEKEKEKEKNQKNRSLSENRKALSNHTKVKIKDVPTGENLSEAPKGGRVDIPLSIQDKSTLLVEMTKEINLGTPDNPKVIHFAASLSKQEKIDFINFFLEKKISFAWSYADMPGLDPELVLHHLPLKAGAKPIKQKLRKMHPQVALLVKVELKKLLDVGFIRPIDYADSISNLVPVSKVTGGIRICTNFRDLNKACPKDDFPLPNIDIIVDMTAGYEMLSLMDGFSGYNQIRIAPEDQHKTAFTCAWGTYCWNVMPFSLKNAGATYQRAMTIIFHDFMHTLMEDYVDDLLCKSVTRDSHLAILGPIFDRMETYKLKLNPKKCVFGVIAGKLLGYIVSHRGIEVDPAKVKAIMDMPPPSNLWQLRSLQGKLQSIRRFIAQLADKFHPFQHLLHKGVTFKWTEQCQSAFQALKEYLLSPPILMPPIEGKSFLLYISATEIALGVLLAQQDENGKERAIYYISRTLVGYELNYSTIERACLATPHKSSDIIC
ncbi:hypothetical protein SUGI_0616090 [Cryptomeria japonica]|nr:hypothetical protein SUGI_0616090 [Cryptomeria japonica]